MNNDNEVDIMKKTYEIEVDCANCANKMEMAAKKTDGVKDATVNFMALKMIVEFDGMPHYTKAKNLLYDIEKTKFYEGLGYKVVRIPFFIQLTQKAIKTLFDIKIQEKMFNENYPSLSIEMENTPAFLCGAGALRMAREFKKFPEQYKINIDFLKKENNIFLSGVDILETLWNSKIC